MLIKRIKNLGITNIEGFNINKNKIEKVLLKIFSDTNKEKIKKVSFKIFSVFLALRILAAYSLIPVITQANNIKISSKDNKKKPVTAQTTDNKVDNENRLKRLASILKTNFSKIGLLGAGVLAGIIGDEFYSNRNKKENEDKKKLEIEKNMIKLAKCFAEDQDVGKIHDLLSGNFSNEFISEIEKINEFFKKIVKENLEFSRQPVLSKQPIFKKQTLIPKTKPKQQVKNPVEIIKQKNEEIRKNLEQLEQLRQEIEKQKQIVVKLKEEKEKLENSNSSLEENNKLLKDRLKTQLDANDENIESRKASNEKIQNLTEELNQKQNELAKFTNLQNQIENLNSENSELKKKSEKQEEEISNLKNEITELKEEKTKVDNELIETKNENSSNKQKISELKQKNSNDNLLNEKLKAELDDLNSSFSERLKKIENGESDISKEIKENLRKLEEENKVLRLNNNELSKKLSNFENEKNTFNTEITKLTQENDKFKKQNVELLDEKSILKKENNSLTENVSTMITEKENLELEIKEINTKFDLKDKECKEKSKVIEDITNQKNISEREKLETEQKLNTAESINLELNDQLTKLKDERDEKELRIKTLEQQVEEERPKISEKDTLIERINIENQRFDQENKNLKKELESHQQSFDELNKKHNRSIKNPNKEIEQFKADIISYKKLIEELRQVIRSSEQTFKSEIAKQKNILNKEKNASISLNSAQEQIQALTSQIQELNSKAIENSDELIKNYKNWNLSEQEAFNLIIKVVESFKKDLDLIINSNNIIELKEQFLKFKTNFQRVLKNFQNDYQNNLGSRIPDFFSVILNIFEKITENRQIILTRANIPNVQGAQDIGNQENPPDENLNNDQEMTLEEQIKKLENLGNNDNYNILKFLKEYQEILELLFSVESLGISQVGEINKLLENHRLSLSPIVFDNTISKRLIPPLKLLEIFELLNSIQNKDFEYLQRFSQIVNIGETKEITVPEHLLQLVRFLKILKFSDSIAKLENIKDVGMRKQTVNDLLKEFGDNNDIIIQQLVNFLKTSELSNSIAALSELSNSIAALNVEHYCDEKQIAGMGQLIKDFDADIIKKKESINENLSNEIQEIVSQLVKLLKIIYLYYSQLGNIDSIYRAMYIVCKKANAPPLILNPGEFVEQTKE
ncbi:MAG: hypothetical protein LBJ32_04260, partial [Oscillospiraceae bacterium]|nr:hypothetical protein [Oscillospiraceae bacterium]